MRLNQHCRISMALGDSQQFGRGLAPFGQIPALCVDHPEAPEDRKQFTLVADREA
jgi:hypothetical protein